MKEIEVNYYAYEDLAIRYYETRADADLKKLAEWYDNYGRMYWNGECYDAAELGHLYPVYSETENEDGDYEIIGWEMRY